MMHNFVVVLGAQPDADSVAFDGFDRRHDAVWMAGVARESTKVWSTKLRIAVRIAVFLSAMRHFRETLLARGGKVE